MRTCLVITSSTGGLQRQILHVLTEHDITGGPWPFVKNVRAMLFAIGHLADHSL